MNDKKVENIIIIGGGPAGLAAAVYNARANLSPLLFAGSPPGGQLTLTSEVENFPGFDHILGPELVSKIRAQAEKFGTRVLDQNILKIDFSAKPFAVTTLDATHYAKAILIATGAKALWLNMPSEEKLKGKGVSACATCDGFFFRGKTVAVVGGGDTALEEALTLVKFAQKVYVIHRRDSFRASKIMQERVLNHPQIEVLWNTVIQEINGEQKVSGIALKTGSEDRSLDLDGVFVAIGHKPDTEVFKGSVACDEQGYILTSAQAALRAASKLQSGGNAAEELKSFDMTYQTMTNVPGVFAAGDCVDHTYRQGATAAGLGVAASLDAERWLELTTEKGKT